MCVIRIAIVDDDRMILNQIETIIKEKTDLQIETETFSDSLEFFNVNNKWNYDIVFLDIDMPDMNGFQVAESIGLLNRKTEIVFVSNLEHLVYDSLKFRPFRFIRKSILSEDIINTIKDFEAEQKKLQEVFVIKTNGTSIPTFISDIIYFESMGHNIFVKNCENVKYQIERKRDNNITMDRLSEQYESKGFIRIHKSFLVNYKYIFVIKNSEILLKNNEKITINPHKSTAIRNQFQNYIILERETHI